MFIINVVYMAGRHFPMAKDELLSELVNSGAFTVDGTSESVVSSLRRPPFMLDMDAMVRTGRIVRLAGMYAGCIKEMIGDDGFDAICSTPVAGRMFASVTADAYNKRYLTKKSWFCVTEAGDRLGDWRPAEHTRAVLVDGVFSMAESGELALGKVTMSAPGCEIIGAVVAVDRQEGADDGRSESEHFTKRNCIPVYAIAGALDLFRKVEAMGNLHLAEQMAKYLRAYSSADVQCSKSVRLGPLDYKSHSGIIISCDSGTLQNFEQVVEQTGSMEEVHGYRIGRGLKSSYPLKDIISAARRHSLKELICCIGDGAPRLETEWESFSGAFAKMNALTIMLHTHPVPVAERAWVYRISMEEMGIIMDRTEFYSDCSQAQQSGSQNPPVAFAIAAASGISRYAVRADEQEILQTRLLLSDAGLRKADINLFGLSARSEGEIKRLKSAAGPIWHAFVGDEITGATGRRYKDAAKAVIRRLSAGGRLCGSPQA